MPIISSAPTGTWRVAASPTPSSRAIGKRPSWSRIMLADRLEFDLTTTATSISPPAPAKIERRRPLPLWRARLEASTLDGEVNIAKVTELPGFAGYRVRPRRRRATRIRTMSQTPFRSPICPRPTAPAKRASPRRSTRCRRRRGRCKPRSWCAWRKPAAARSSASSRCRSRRRHP